MNIKVRFKGRLLWWIKDNDTCYGALAPIHHCDETGELNVNAVGDDSFAHVYHDGVIARYGEIIGTVDDLEIV